MPALMQATSGPLTSSGSLPYWPYARKVHADGTYTEVGVEGRRPRRLQLLSTCRDRAPRARSRIRHASPRGLKEPGRSAGSGREGWRGVDVRLDEILARSGVFGVLPVEG